MQEPFIKKALAIVLVIAVVLTFAVSGVLAAPSPEKGNQYKAQIIKKNGTVYKTTAKGKATVSKLASKGKTKTIKGNILISGKKYTINKVAAKAFSKCKNLKIVKIKWKTMKNRTFSAKAFKGLKKTRLKKIKISINKKMPKKDYKKLRKALLKAGISKKNIKRR